MNLDAIIYYFRLFLALAIFFAAGALWQYTGIPRNAGEILAILFVVGGLIVAPCFDHILQLHPEKGQ